jgi:PAS domain S-box-containing protein
MLTRDEWLDLARKLDWEFSYDWLSALKLHAATVPLAEFSPVVGRLRGDGAGMVETETQFRTMANSAPVLLWMAGRDGLSDFFNDRWLAFTGRTLAEELGSGRAAGVHPEDFRRCMTTYMEAFVARRAFTIEYRLRRADGEYRWIFDQGAPRLDTDGEFAGFIGSCVDVTEQRLAQDALRRLNDELKVRVPDSAALAEERQRLVREVRHRVKNDLQFISSVLNMQERRLSDGPALRALEDCRDRIETIALIHESMSQSDDLVSLPLARDIRSRAASVLRVSGQESGAVALEIETPDEIVLDADRAIPCGLILNELMTNALKHAFPGGRTGTLRVVLRRDGDDRAALIVEDDGVGVPPELERPARDSMGFRLVQALAKELRGELRVRRNPGTSVGVFFPLAD